MFARERGLIYKQAGFAESFVKPVDVNQVINAIGRVMTGVNSASP
jgi:hypothetical protein